MFALISHFHSRFISLLLRGETNRAVAATEMNERSSRSHSVFRIIVQSKAKDEASPERVAVLNLVDLAGSEALSPTASRVRQAECKHINKSLLGLRRVIITLAEGGASASGSDSPSAAVPHIPYADVSDRTLEAHNFAEVLVVYVRMCLCMSVGRYRETKLTRVLQSALGGNSHTAFICTLCPTVAFREESHNTLRFASFARKVCFLML